jgi:hypothetical protein
MSVEVTLPTRTTDGPSIGVLKPQKRKGYKKIRFKAWTPSKPDDQHEEATSTETDPARQTTTKSAPDGSKAAPPTAASYPTPISTPTPSSYTMVYPSPLTRLPVNGTRQNPFLKLPITATTCVASTIDYCEYDIEWKGRD